MSMVPFYKEFPDIAFEKTKVVKVDSDEEILPPDEYIFFEWYCDDLDCDCGRTVIHVISGKTQKDLAVINYAWGNLNWKKCLYARQRTPNTPVLETIHEQTELAPLILEMFKSIIEIDPDYVKSFESNHKMFRDTLKQKNK